MSERWQPVPVPSGPDPLGDDGRVAVYRRLVEDFAHCHRDVPEEVRRQMAMLAAASVRALMGELAALKDISGLPSAGESPAPTAGDAPRAETKNDPPLKSKEIRKGTGDVMRDLKYAQRYMEEFREGDLHGRLGLEMGFVERALRVAIAEITQLRRRVKTPPDRSPGTSRQEEEA